MKAFAIVLLCALAAVQGRHTALQSTRTAAALGENPWFVHLRIAVSTSGLLNTGAGSLISSGWVLTSATNVIDARFIWVRYGVVNVVNPSLVTENTLTRTHSENTIALININRIVHPTDFIAPIPLGEFNFGDPAKFCNFGEQNGAPGEQLNCYEVEVDQEQNNLVIYNDVSVYDHGAPLVSNGAQVGLLVDAETGKFLRTSRFKDWIEQETGLNLSPEHPEAVRFIQ